MAPTSKIVFPISIYASHSPKTHHLNPSLTGQLVTAIMPRDTLELVHRFSALAGNKSTKTGGDVETSPNLSCYSWRRVWVIPIMPFCLLPPWSWWIRVWRAVWEWGAFGPYAPAGQYEVDWLIAVGLWNWVRQQLEIQVSALEIVGAGTLTALCETLLDKLAR